MQLHAIFAVSTNGTIGKNNTLPWRQRDDLKRFKKLTKGHPMVMGRKTFESLPGILPARDHFVLTRNEDHGIMGTDVVEVFHNENLPDKIMAWAAVNELRDRGVEQAFIIGGSEIYKLFWPRVDYLHITEIHAHIEGDTKLDLDLSDFKEVDREWHACDARNQHDYSFVTYKRDIHFKPETTKYING